MLYCMLQMKHECFRGPDGFPDEAVAIAHLEESALRLFDHADEDDRAANFSK